MTTPQEARLSCAVIDSATGLRTSRDELARLAETPGAASGIVQHPDWLAFELAWRGADATLHLVVASNGLGQVIGYAPFLVEQHRAQLALGKHRVSIYRGRTWRLLGAGVVALTDDRSMVERMIAATLQRDRSVRVMRIQETELPNRFAAALSQGKGAFATVQANLLEQLNWVIQPQASSASYLATLGSKRRNDLTRRLRNMYKKLGDQAELRLFDRAEQIDEYAALMNQVYARSWHASAQAIDWELPARRSLFQRLAAGGQVIGHMLMLGGRPIAYVHGYRLGGRYLLDDTGYDEEFASLGVGSALVFQAVQDLLDRYPGEVIDFGYGDNQYKRVLADRQTTCGSLYMVRGVLSRLCFGLIGPVRWLYRRVHRAMRSAKPPSPQPSPPA
jgi:CelD/BcsL family acetyltransferase involved in cellulose biosynthesis